MAERTRDLQKQMDDLWTTRDLHLIFGREPMTIHLWRRKGLPAIVIPSDQRPAIRFVPVDVIAWAKKNNIKVRRLKAA